MKGIVMGKMLDHARRELEVAGVLDAHSETDRKAGETLLSLIETFENSNPTGIEFVVIPEVFVALCLFENLSPLTSNPDEWMDRSELSGYPLWQSKRNPRYFSNDGCKTWYSLDEKIAESLAAQDQTQEFSGNVTFAA